MTTSSNCAAICGRVFSVFSAGRFIAVLGAGLLISGCVQPSSYMTTIGAPTPGSSPKVLIMTPDVELSVLTAGGLLEPNAEWTETAKQHLDVSLSEVMSGKSVTIASYEKIADVGPESLTEAQVLKLHEAVGSTILLHKYRPNMGLPTKKDKFDWTLGGSVASLQKRYDADYVIFVYLRDSFSSPGRVAANIVLAALGAGVQGGQQTGYTSLVDLKTGDVVWFNTLFSETGDLRTEEGSQRAIKNLLGKAPL